MDLSLARVLQAQGNGDKALGLVEKAMEIAIKSSGSAIDDRLVEVSLARLWLQQSNLTGVVEWSAKRGFDQKVSGRELPENESHIVPYDIREAEWLVYVRLQLAQNQADAALSTLAALLAEAEKQGRNRRLIEILVLTAIAYQVSGFLDHALEYLERSLKLAEPEEYTRVYIDEGLPMIKLLREAVRRGIKKQYCNRLLSAFQQEQRLQKQVTLVVQGALIEPLSERELEVLKMLAEGYTNREICERLYISLSTVKGHISNIMGKLLASNRTEAVARARQSRILP
jgi:LuxR family maltose regulon positive regulatory protein